MNNEDNELRNFLKTKYGIEYQENSNKMNQFNEIKKKHFIPLWLIILLMYLCFIVLKFYISQNMTSRGMIGAFGEVTGGFLFFWIFRIVAQFTKRKENYDKNVDNVFINILFMACCGMLSIFF
jgi:hypothetical protein